MYVCMYVCMCVCIGSFFLGSLICEDQSMGNCVGGGNSQNNVFKVVNINDNKSQVQKGVMEVTLTELVYVDGKTKEDWHWPLKYLRKYGCDGDVFTFEAGRKCPGGEGLYAFSANKANILFDMVAKNINQGDLSPVPEPQPPVVSMDFPLRRTSTASPTREQPSYTNLDLTGHPIENNNHVPLPEAVITPPDPTKFVYREVVFDRTPEEHPKPPTAPSNNTSYTQIDFDQTTRYNSEVMGGAVSALSPHTRTNSASTTMSGNLSPTKQRGRRTRVHTYSGRDRHVSRSESSFSSQSSLTESTRDVRGHNGVNSRTSASVDPSPSMYQNVHVGSVQDQQYQNVQVGAGEVSQLFDTTQQPNYCNVSLSANGGGASSVPTPGPLANGMGHDIMASSDRDTMTTYAQLELSSDRQRSQRTMSSSGTPRDSAQQASYTQLDFPAGGHGEEEPGSRGYVPNRRSASISGATANGHRTTHSIAEQNIPEEVSVVTPSLGARPRETVDETKVTYGVLNFAQMEALTVLSVQREQEIELEKEQREKEQRERERANTHNKKKKGQHT